MLAYRENNIIFRIASADAISKFKEVQSHSFIQINRKEFEFDNKSKEALLLEYDRFSQLIIKLERLLLMDDIHNITPALQSFIVSSIVDEFNSIEEICHSYVNTFSSDITRYLKAIHNYSKQIIAENSARALRLSGEKAFPRVVRALSDYLQHALCALHEYDNNVIKQRPGILSYSAFSHSAAGGPVVPIVKRAQYFVQLGLPPEFELKNYVNSQINPSIYSQLTELGVKFNVTEHQLELA